MSGEPVNVPLTEDERVAILEATESIVAIDRDVAVEREEPWLDALKAVRRKIISTFPVPGPGGGSDG